MNLLNYVILFVLIALFIFYIYFYKNNINENFVNNNLIPYSSTYILNKPITTWTPYIIDNEYQPGYSNYFYNNGYMYPIF